MQFSRVERQIFDISSEMVLGDGASALFWKDKWMEGRSMEEVAPNLFAVIPKRRRRNTTVREALVNRRWIADIAGALRPLALLQYVEVWRYTQRVQLAATPDRLLWR